MMRAAWSLALMLIAAGHAGAQRAPELSRVDRVRLREAFRLADAVGDRLWPEWKSAPFAVLLVTPEHEFLTRHPTPSPDFSRLGFDSLLASEVFVRARTHRTDLLATFPAIAGSVIPTIVIGRAEQTAARTSTPWVLSLLHEHFHQLQYSRPGYYDGVAGLGLARGDQTGMWMLTFPFPYTRPGVGEQFATLSRLLDAALAAPPADAAGALANYLAGRRAFQAALAADDYRYLGFQLWQEGIARYTEYQVARLAAAGYDPEPAFAALEDVTPYAQLADTLHRRILRDLAAGDLAGARRTAFYSFGAAEALLLDKINPGWRGRYFAERFDLHPLFSP